MSVTSLLSRALVILIAGFIAHTYAGDHSLYELTGSKSDNTGSHGAWDVVTLSGDRRATHRAMQVKVGDVLTMPIPGHRDVAFTITRRSRSYNRNTVLRGYDDEGRSLSLVISSSDVLQGTFFTPAGSFRLQLKGDLGQLTSIDQSKHHQRRVDRGVYRPHERRGGTKVEQAQGIQAPRPMIPHSKSSVSAPKFFTGQSVLDVLFYVDDSFEGYEAALDEAFELLNVVLENNNLGITARIADIVFVDIDETETALATIDKMDSASFPFEDIEADRARTSPDLIHVFREPPPTDFDTCGIAALGLFDGFLASNLFAVTGVTIWDPPVGNGPYCPISTLAHEVGHNFGLQHDRGDLVDMPGRPDAAAPYSFGYVGDGSIATVMGVTAFIGATEYITFSDPDRRCPPLEACGVPADQPNSANNVLAMNNVKHMITGRSDGFSPEFVQVFKETTPDFDCADGSTSTLYAVGISNGSQQPIQLVSTTYLNAQGQVVFEGTRNEVLAPGFVTSGGYCASSNVIGSNITAAYWTYIDPDVDEFRRTAAVLWEPGRLGDDNLVVRIATSDGGSVVGQPERAGYAGDVLEVSFLPLTGNRLDSVTSTCGGQLNGNTYTTEPLAYDCRLEASFKSLSAPTTLFRHALEEPVTDQTHMGVGNLRGWALADEGIARIEVYIDGAYAFDAPYGGQRNDVGSAFPDVSGSNLSGYSLAFNYSDLSPGNHEITAVAISGTGNTLEASAQFQVTGFDQNFIPPSAMIDLNGVQCIAETDSLTLLDALIGERRYDLVVEWRTSEQGFEIIDIR